MSKIKYRRLEAVVNHLSLKVSSKKKLSKVESKPTWLIVTEVGKFVLKLKSQSLGKKQKLLNFINNRETDFNNELTINNHLKLCKFECFRSPELLKTDNNNYLLFDYIPSDKGWNRTDIPMNEFLKSILEFQTSNIKLQNKLRDKTLFHIMRKPTIEMVIWSMKVWTKYDLKSVIKILGTIAKCSLLEKKNSMHFLLHNDLHMLNNVLSSQDKFVYLCDFERSLEEKKWVLLDIVDLCMNSNPMDFDSELFEKYITLFKSYTCTPEKINIQTQVRIGVLRIIIKKMIYDSLENEKYGIQWKELLNTISSDEKYKKWYDNRISISYNMA